MVGSIRQKLLFNTIRKKSYAHRATFSSKALVDALKREAAIDIHPEVQEALSHQRPVVALETALVTNGVAPPTNLEIGRKLEATVREQGAVPATIGVIAGRVKIGLHDADLQRLADIEGNKSLVKISRRDIGPVLALEKDGGTTICATLIFAHMAGIRVFATGGLGGVHRGGENSMDVSADLHELTRCPVGLVSAGVKSILDIGRTLEYLETLGIPVVTYGKTYDFPGFYCGESGFKTNWKVNDPLSAARILDCQRRLGLQNGTLFAAPVPDEYVAQGAEIQAAVDQAIAESEGNGMSKKGKEVTPWLLGRVVEITGGKSLQSNLALLENTAVIGGQIAVQYSKLENQEQGATGASSFFPSLSSILGTSESMSVNQTSLSSSKGTPLDNQPQHMNSLANEPKGPAKLVVVGASAVDITARISPTEGGQMAQVAQTTTPGTVSLTVGGVARNIAEAAHRVLSSTSVPEPDSVLLVSPVGLDEFAPFLLQEHSRLGMRKDGFITSEEEKTAICNIILDADGALVCGVADMDITYNIPEHKILNHLGQEDPSLIVLDGNLSPSSLSAIIKHVSDRGKRPSIFFEPTSVPKATSVFPAIFDRLVTNGIDPSKSPVTYASPNVFELSHLYREASSESHKLTDHEIWWNTMNAFNLGSEWRMDLEQLARQSASATDDKGDLSFIVKDGLAQMAINLLPFFQNLIVKCGEKGVIIAMRISGSDARESMWKGERSNPLNRYIVAHGIQNKEIVVLKHFPAPSIRKDEIVSVTGAGDSLVGALAASIVTYPTVFHDPVRLEASIRNAQEAAVLSLHSIRAISPLLGSTAVGR